MKGSVTEVWIELREPTGCEGSRKLLLPLGLGGQRKKVIFRVQSELKSGQSRCLAGTAGVEGLSLQC